MAKKELSPSGSFKGYALGEYIVRNKELIKNLVSAAAALVVAVLAANSITIPPAVFNAAVPLLWLVFHMFISAIEFRQSNVELK